MLASSNNINNNNLSSSSSSSSSPTVPSSSPISNVSGGGFSLSPISPYINEYSSNVNVISGNGIGGGGGVGPLNNTIINRRKTGGGWDYVNNASGINNYNKRNR